MIYFILKWDIFFLFLYSMANNGFMHLSKYKARYGLIQASQVTLVVKNPPANAGDLKRHGFDPWWCSYFCLCVVVFNNPFFYSVWTVVKPRVTFSFQTWYCFCCSVSKLSLPPHGLQHARLLCRSLSSEVCSNTCPLSQWCYPTISSSAVSFHFCLQSSVV